jgi:tetratricopeptide (TPR) repeat protein
MMPRAGQSRGFFIGLRKDQLGARLLMMLNSMRLADDYETDFRINWFPRGAAAPKLDTPLDLFDPAFIDRHFIDNDDFERLAAITKPIDSFRRDADPKRLEAHLASGGHVLLDEGFEIERLPWEEGEEHQDRFRAFISRIDFNQVVKTHMAEIEDAMSALPGPVFAYHIRRGDILNEAPWKHKEWPSKIEPDELYSAYLKKNPDAAALVFSDQPESIAGLMATHPQLRSMTDLVNLAQCKPVQRDFLELYAMSRAAQIIAPPVSAFSRAAARLSGQERKCFHEVMDIAERDVAYDSTIARFQEGVSAFITPSEAAHIYVKVARRLQVAQREEEAWEFADKILKAGADNAFLPLIQAANCIYLSKWDEALEHVETAIEDPNQWQENYVSALALRAHILGALGKAVQARNSFLSGFWQKPSLPDVTVVGTFMIRRQRLRPGEALPFDRETVMALQLGYQLHNIVLQQNKIIRARALDLSAIAIEWPWFALDGKTKKLLNAKHALKAMRAKLVESDQYAPGAGPFSFCALLDARMGKLDNALAQNTQALNHAPEDQLIRKRQAEILMLKGDHDGALAQMATCIALGPDHAFWHFLTGLIHEGALDRHSAGLSFERCTEMDDTTAALHAHVAAFWRKTGNLTAAIAALDRAARIAPNQQRYRNKRDRMMRQKG